MRIFFDTEFTGLEKSTDLLSIGIISDDNKKFYWEFNDYDYTKVDDWIKDNVIKNCIYLNPDNNGIVDTSDLSSYCSYGDKEECKEALTKWLNQFESVELVSDVAHYDMVLFIDIFGHAFNLPSHVCPSCHDINQDIARFHNVDLYTAFDMSRELILDNNNIVIEGEKHNAFYDAKVIKEIYYLMNRGDNQ